MALPMGQPGAYSAIIDARSEDEFALDHLPGAVNWPSLNNEQRIVIGTLYKQAGPFEAKKKGAGLVAANIASHIEKHIIDLPKSWQPSGLLLARRQTQRFLGTYLGTNWL
jgi:tRNA 2-selenouridine synthase